jgi:stage II sporulation protein D
MKKLLKRLILIFIATLFFSMLSSGCTNNEERRLEESEPEDRQQEEEEVKKPPLPEQLKDDRSIVVYKVDEGTKESIDVEEYVAGVLGGEIHNDWPEESIKAQAILARTFVMKFLTDKTSKYEGADVSTDIQEAQAWNQEEVNEALNKAVQDTSGMVAVYDGNFINAWFHSHAGGKTATAKEGLNYKEEEPNYIHNVDSPDSNEAPQEDAQWTVEFTKQQIIQAANETGKNISNVEDIQIGETGPSGRAMTFTIGGEELAAAELRKALDSTKLKSTFISSIDVQGDKVIIKGKGYGHGVGMSQWGAYAMAKDGKKAEDIVKHYFKDINIVKLWD